MLLTYQNHVIMPKTAFINMPFLIALLITSLIHGLVLLKLKVDFSPALQSSRTINITLIKPLPPPTTKTEPITSPQATVAVPAKPGALNNQSGFKREAHAAPTKPTKIKKRYKPQRIMTHTPTFEATKPPEKLAEAVPPEPIYEPIEPTVAEPVITPKIEEPKVIEPIVPKPVITPKVEEPKVIPEPIVPKPVITPKIEEPKIISEPTFSEPVPEKFEPVNPTFVPVEKRPIIQSETAAPETETQTVEIPEEPTTKARKKKKRSKSVEETPPPLSLDDLSAQIAQVGEKYANQSLKSEENSEKAVNSSRKSKMLATQYKRDWRSKVERVANSNYPEIARQEGFYARVTLEVGINSDGSLSYVRIKKSSGIPELDSAVKNIVQMAAPFAELPTALAESLKGGVFPLSQGISFSNESVQIK